MSGSLHGAEGNVSLPVNIQTGRSMLHVALINFLGPAELGIQPGILHERRVKRQVPLNSEWVKRGFPRQVIGSTQDMFVCFIIENRL